MQTSLLQGCANTMFPPMASQHEKRQSWADANPNFLSPVTTWELEHRRNQVPGIAQGPLVALGSRVLLAFFNLLQIEMSFLQIFHWKQIQSSLCLPLYQGRMFSKHKHLRKHFHSIYQVGWPQCLKTFWYIWYIWHIFDASNTHRYVY